MRHEERLRVGHDHRELTERAAKKIAGRPGGGGRRRRETTVVRDPR
jgi:hypothetical protein